MNRVIKTVLITFILLLNAGRAEAYVLDSSVMKEKIKQSVEKQIKTELNKNLSVEIVSIPYLKIETKNENIEIKTQANLKFISSSMIVRVSLLVDGVLTKSFTARVSIDSENNKTVNANNKNILAGQNLVIRRDNTISVVFKADRVSVTMPGIALNNGCIGDYIKVRSQDHKKLYQGKVIGENLVLVEI